MFGGSFALKDEYRKLRGSEVKTSFQYALTGGIGGLILLCIINGISLKFTPFTLIMAVFSALNGFLFSLCAFKALGKTNLSVYSLFSMLGGMVLPFLQGIIFYGEPLTVAKSVCFALIVLSLSFTIQKGNKSGGFIYYAGVFVFNGMSGVLTKIFTSAPYPKASATDYSMWATIVSLVISLIVLLTVFRKKSPDEKPQTFLSETICVSSGTINKIGNLLLVIALAHVDASVQYPMVTGGVMIMSTIISLLGKNKPTVKQLVSVGVAFIGLLALFLIPV
jgi:multidrug transporter EmrE-like cation transporter